MSTRYLLDTNVLSEPIKSHPDAQTLESLSEHDGELATCSVVWHEYSVAEARQHFARLIERAQQGRTIEITRRGKPVAVLLSASEYSAITGERPSFVDAVRQVRERLGVDELEIGDAEFEGLREESPGREISV